MPETITPSDHDLLVEVRTLQNVMFDEIKEIKSGTALDIANLKKDKADRKDIDFVQKKLNDDIEIRVRKLETDTIPKEKQEKFEDSLSTIEKRLIWIIAYSAGAAAVIAFGVDIISRFFNIGR